MCEELSILSYQKGLRSFKIHTEITKWNQLDRILSEKKALKNMENWLHGY